MLMLNLVSVLTVTLFVLPVAVHLILTVLDVSI
jgi:hypothetical protein